MLNINWAKAANPRFACENARLCCKFEQARVQVKRDFGQP